MTYYPLQPRYHIYVDSSGNPLTGYLYLGDVAKDPTLYPAKVAWDQSGLYPVEFPVTVQNGYPIRDGKPAQLFLSLEDNAQYSSLIQDENGNTVFSDPSGLSGYFPNESQLTLNPSPGSDLTANGITATKTVDATASFGDLLFLSSDGKYDLADATNSSLVPCSAMSLESGSGSKQILKQGYVRDDSWAWTPGGLLYVSTTAGSLTQTAPSGSGNVVQIVGAAETETIIYFDPEYTTVEVA